MKQSMCMSIGLISLCMAACQQGNRDARREAAPVKVKTVQVVPETVEKGECHYSGTVEERVATPLSFSVSGTVEAVHFRVGGSVEKGQLLATLDETSLQSGYDAAKATLEQAEDACSRMKELHDKGSLAEIKWVEVQSKLKQARSMEEMARKSLEDCRLYAPFGGVIADKSIEIGQNVLPGVSIGKIVGVDGLKVRIAVPESEIARVALRQKAVVRVPASGGRSFGGVVSEKGVVANPLSRSYEVKISVTDAGGALLPGMVAEVVLDGSGSQPAFVVPAWIVQIDERNRPFVWLRADGKATRRFVTIGTYTADGVTVVSGLDAGDEIITEGRQKVCEGTEVCL